MPITIDEWNNGRKWDTLEARILTVLRSKRDKALTTIEIIAGIGYTSDRTDFWGFVGTLTTYWTVENALSALVKEGSVKARVINTSSGEETYYMAT